MDSDEVVDAVEPQVGLDDEGIAVEECHRCARLADGLEWTNQ